MREAAHPERVVARVAQHDRVAGDRAHVDGVGTAAGLDRRGTGVGRVHGEGVRAVAELDGEVLEVGVRDTTGHLPSGEHPVRRHAEPGDAGARQGADVSGRAVLVVDHERVDLGGLDGLDRARGRRRRVARRLARQQHRQVTVERERDDRVGVLAAADEQRALDQGEPPGRVRERLEVAAVDDRVVDGGQRHGLRRRPGATGEREHQAAVGGERLPLCGVGDPADLDQVAAVGGVAVRAVEVERRGGDRQQPDGDRLGARRPGEPDRERVGGTELPGRRALHQAGVALAGRDDDSGCVGVLDQGRHQVDEDARDADHDDGAVQRELGAPRVDDRDGRRRVGGDHPVVGPAGGPDDAQQRAGESAVRRRQGGTGERDGGAVRADRRDRAADFTVDRR